MQAQPNMIIFFKDQRWDERNEPDAVQSQLVIQTNFTRPRGIRPWEKAKFENNIRRQRQQEYYDNQKKTQMLKNKKFSLPVKKEEKKEEDWESSIVNINTTVVPADFVSTGNDAWDD